MPSPAAVRKTLCAIIMGQTKKEKQQIRDKEFCKKYLTADWDGCVANEYFANMCDSSPTDKYGNKPKGEPFDSLRIIAIADSKLYSSIAHLAFEKNKLVTYLRELTLDKISVPTYVDNQEKFKTAFLATGKDVLLKIDQGLYKFQVPGH